MKKSFALKLAFLLLCVCQGALYAQQPGNPQKGRAHRTHRTIPTKKAAHDPADDKKDAQVFKGTWSIPSVTEGAAEINLYEKQNYEVASGSAFCYGHFFIMRGATMMDDDVITKASINGNKATLTITCGRSGEDSTVVLLYHPNTGKITVESNDGTGEGCFLYPGTVLQKK